MEMTRPLPWCPITRCMMRRSTEASLVVRPGDSTLVESLMKSVAPSLPEDHKHDKLLSNCDNDKC